MRIEWSTEVGQLAAIEPAPAEIAAHAAALAAGYNDPANAQLMGHAEPISPDDVVEHYAGMIEAGGRAFLPSHAQAEQVVSIVGIKNAQAGYFGGQTRLMAAP